MDIKCKWNVKVKINRGVYPVIIFKQLKNIYCARDLLWLKDVEENMIQPMLLNKWFMMNNNTLIKARLLDKYTFNLPPKMFAAMAWAKLIPKTTKTPFVKYIKKKEDNNAYQIIIDKIRKQLQLSDNDYKHDKKRIIKYIDDNKQELFTQFGIAKKEWKKHGLDFKDIKSGGVREGKKGLDLWGL